MCCVVHQSNWDTDTRHESSFTIALALRRKIIVGIRKYHDWLLRQWDWLLISPELCASIHFLLLPCFTETPLCFRYCSAMRSSIVLCVCLL